MFNDCPICGALLLRDPLAVVEADFDCSTKVPFSQYLPHYWVYYDLRGEMFRIGEYFISRRKGYTCINNNTIHSIIPIIKINTVEKIEKLLILL